MSDEWLLGRIDRCALQIVDDVIPLSKRKADNVGKVPFGSA